MSVKSAGAEMCSLYSKTNQLEYLWQADPAVWARHAPILFPIVGKLKNNSYHYQGTNYTLPQHGFARDMEFRCVEQNETQLLFELVDDETTFKVYPFHFSLIVGYELREQTLLISYTVFNPANVPMYYSIGAHPGFNCPLIPGEQMEDYTLTIAPATTLQCSSLQDGLLSGNTYDVPLQNQVLQLSPALFANDALVMLNRQVDKISMASGKSGHGLELTSAGWPCYGIWSKKGNEKFLCLEPWQGVADSISSDGDLTGKPFIHQLAPLQTEVFTHSIRLF
ncbi:MAG: aldose 1-epimerase family protein [Bacteroidetes bacterium]|nr:aldose 1-epimerase family protein [Bacteroidota bacterium]